jgi:hypothetical protein
MPVRHSPFYKLDALCATQPKIGISDLKYSQQLRFTETNFINNKNFLKKKKKEPIYPLHCPSADNIRVLLTHFLV